jgi:hypothetical protein
MTDKPEGVQLYTDRADFIFADVALGITRKEYDAMQDDDEWKEIPIVYEGLWGIRRTESAHDAR